MTAMNGRIWKVAFLLSLILPIGSLATVKLSGFLSGPLTLAQTTTLEPVVWNSERPLWFFHFGQWVNSSFSDCGSMDFSVFSNEFSPNVFSGSDVLSVYLTTTMGLAEGYVENVTLTIQDDNPASWVQLINIESGNIPSMWIDWKNLSLASYREGLDGRSNTEKASVMFLGQNHAQEASAYIWLWWLLESPENETQQLSIRFETTYFNGTVYKKVVQPFLLKLVGDNENTFETAREITANETVIDFIGGDDSIDIFKVHLRSNQTLNVTIPPRKNWEIVASFFGPNDENHPLAESWVLYEVDPTTQSIVLKVDSYGWYYVKIKCIAGIGPYSVIIEAS